MGDENKKSFWTSLPGILTGVAAVIAAVGGILAAYNHVAPPPSPPTSSPPSPSNPLSSPSPWRIQVQKERSGAYTRAPSLSGLYSPANSQIQTAFVQDNKRCTVNGICHDVGQKENQTRIYPLHM